MNYKELVENFAKNPRDVSTKPITNRPGKWFYVYVKNEKIIVDVARQHEPKCSIRQPRTLSEKEIDDIYELYIKRIQGFAVSKQAASITMNQVYWYGIFNDMEV